MNWNENEICKNKSSSLEETVKHKTQSHLYSVHHIFLFGHGNSKHLTADTTNMSDLEIFTEDLSFDYCEWQQN